MTLLLALSAMQKGVRGFAPKDPLLTLHAWASGSREKRRRREGLDLDGVKSQGTDECKEKESGLISFSKFERSCETVVQIEVEIAVAKTSRRCAYVKAGFVA